METREVAYQKNNLLRMLFSGFMFHLGTFTYLVSHAMKRMNKLYLGAFINFSSEGRDKDIHDVTHTVKVIIPYVFDNHGSGYHFFFMAKENLQDGKLFGGKHNLALGAGNVVFDRIKCNISDCERW